MLGESEKKSNFGIGLAIALYFTAFLSFALASIYHNTGIATAGPVALLLGNIMLAVGCMYYAEGKGHSAVWGALALFGLLGVLVVYLLPDKRPKPEFTTIEEASTKAA